MLQNQYKFTKVRGHLIEPPLPGSVSRDPVHRALVSVPFISDARLLETRSAHYHLYPGNWLALLILHPPANGYSLVQAHCIAPRRDASVPTPIYQLGNMMLRIDVNK